jgi:hypothetical protein
VSEHTKCTYREVSGPSDGVHRILVCDGCGNKYRQTEAWGHYWRQYWDAEDDFWGINVVWPIELGWEPPPIDTNAPATWTNTVTRYEVTE